MWALLAEAALFGGIVLVTVWLHLQGYGRNNGAQILIVLLPLSLYLFWHLYHLWKLLAYLRGKQVLPPKTAIGLWHLLIQQLARREQDNEQMRHQQEEQASFVYLQNLPDAIFIIRSNRQIVYVNSVANRLLFAEDSEQKALTADITKYLDKQLPELVLRIDKCLAGKQQDGKTWVMQFASYSQQSFQVFLHKLTKGNCLLLLRDITREQKIIQIQKDFIANVSHELRTPLTVLNGYLETLPQNTTRQLKPVFMQMRQQSCRMQALVEDLLILSQLQALPPARHEKIVMLAPLIRQVTIDLQWLLENKQHQLQLQLEEPLYILGVEKQIYSVISNLYRNAIMYTTKGGQIQITLFTRNKNDNDNSRVVIVQICDNGDGIAAQHIPRLCERFYRVDKGRSREQGGTGLGLAIVEQILTLHQAHLEIQSESGKGSCFSCIFQNPIDNP